MRFQPWDWDSSSLQSKDLSYSLVPGSPGMLLIHLAFPLVCEGAMEGFKTAMGPACWVALKNPSTVH